MALDIARIRNVGFVGHGGVGKTSLVEALLFAAGAVTRLGRVDDGTPTTDFDPDEMAGQAKEYREKLIEAAAETDDELLNKYLEEGSIDEAEMVRALRAGIAQGKIMPVLCASASRNIGGQDLLDLIVESFPSPLDRGDVDGTDQKTGQGARRAPDPKAPAAALVFKTLSDPHVGKLSLFRVYSGTIGADSPLLNASRGLRERMGH